METKFEYTLTKILLIFRLLYSFCTRFFFCLFGSFNPLVTNINSDVRWLAAAAAARPLRLHIAFTAASIFMMLESCDKWRRLCLHWSFIHIGFRRCGWRHIIVAMYAFAVLLTAAAALSQPPASSDHFGMFIDDCVCVFERRRHLIVTADALYIVYSLLFLCIPPYNRNLR